MKITHPETGEVMHAYEKTLDELARLARLAGVELEVRREDLVCKPTIETATAPFKEGAVLDLVSHGATVLWFITEGERDIAYLQASEHIADEVGGMHILFVDFPLSGTGEAMDPDTPVWRL